MQHISLLLKPSSYRCNIECEYCFYKRVEGVYHPENTFMTPETADALVRTTLQLGCRENLFCWQGGEPTLMGLDFFRRVVDAQRRYASPGQVIGNSLQTNGILIDEEWARFLGEHRFLVGLSLDGPKDIHDRYRRHRSGEGSFEEVMNAASLLRSHGAEFNVLALLTDANIREPERVYRFFRRRGFSHLQFVPCFEKDPRTGEHLPFSVRGEDLGRFHQKIFDLWLEDFPNVSVRLFEDIFIYFIDGGLVSCNWKEQCDSYLLIEHNGDAYPCDFFVYPEWKLGNVLEDSYREIMNSPLRRKFAAMKQAVAQQCRGCRWLQFCHGDCTKFRLDADGNHSDVSAYCQARKMLLEHVHPRLDEVREKVMRIRRARHSRAARSQTGRNDPCPCGSGLKYKRCCGS